MVRAKLTLNSSHFSPTQARAERLQPIPLSESINIMNTRPKNHSSSPPLPSSIQPPKSPNKKKKKSKEKNQQNKPAPKLMNSNELNQLAEYTTVDYYGAGLKLLPSSCLSLGHAYKIGVYSDRSIAKNTLICGFLSCLAKYLLSATHSKAYSNCTLIYISAKKKKDFGVQFASWYVITNRDVEKGEELVVYSPISQVVSPTGGSAPWISSIETLFLNESEVFLSFRERVKLINQSDSLFDPYNKAFGVNDWISRIEYRPQPQLQSLIVQLFNDIPAGHTARWFRPILKSEARQQRAREWEGEENKEADNEELSDEVDEVEEWEEDDMLILRITRLLDSLHFGWYSEMIQRIREVRTEYYQKFKIKEGKEENERKQSNKTNGIALAEENKKYNERIEKIIADTVQEVKRNNTQLKKDLLSKLFEEEEEEESTESGLELEEQHTASIVQSEKKQKGKGESTVREMELKESSIDSTSTELEEEDQQQQMETKMNEEQHNEQSFSLASSALTNKTAHAEKEWICSKCTLTNEASKKRCLACSAHRPLVEDKGALERAENNKRRNSTVESNETNKRRRTESNQLQQREIRERKEADTEESDAIGGQGKERVREEITILDNEEEQNQQLSEQTEENATTLNPESQQSEEEEEKEAETADINQEEVQVMNEESVDEKAEAVETVVNGSESPYLRDWIPILSSAESEMLQKYSTFNSQLVQQYEKDIKTIFKAVSAQLEDNALFYEQQLKELKEELLGEQQKRESAESLVKTMRRQVQRLKAKENKEKKQMNNESEEEEATGKRKERFRKNPQSTFYTQNNQTHIKKPNRTQ